MVESLRLSDSLRRLFPDAGPKLQRLVAAVEREGGLLYADAVTIRDLLDLSGYGEHEPLHVLLLVMLLALEDGSVCVELTAKALARRLVEAGAAEEEAAEWGARVADDVARHGFPNLIGRQLSDARPLVWRERAGSPLLYFHRLLHAEEIVRRELKRLLGRQASFLEPAALHEVLRDVLERAPACRNGRPLSLNRQQRLALALALVRDFVIITGGPGTGKTSVVFTLLRCLVRRGTPLDRIALAAPTGRAAHRLGEALQQGLAMLPGLAADAPEAGLASLAPVTLHQLLGYVPATGSYRRHAENPLEADVVVIDEVSMVGIDLMGQLLQAIGPATKLVLLGDRDQLPSVDAGAVLADLAAASVGFSATIRKTLQTCFPDLDPPAIEFPHPLTDTLAVLDENYRSQADIVAVARAINRQEAQVVEGLRRLPAAAFPPREGTEGVWLLEQEESAPAAWRRTLLRYAEAAYLDPGPDGSSLPELAQALASVGDESPSRAERERLEQLFGYLNRTRILTLLRDGPWGAGGINRLLGRRLRPRLDPRAMGEWFAGAPVLITRNDRERQLYNGDVGITLRGRDGCRAVFRVGGEFVSHPIESLPAHELAFAITVHKSQGSEFDQVLLVLPPEGGRRLLTKEMVYTALTRARRLAVVWASAAVLRSAVERRVQRDSGLWEFWDREAPPPDSTATAGPRGMLGRRV